MLNPRPERTHIRCGIGRTRIVSRALTQYIVLVFCAVASSCGNGTGPGDTKELPNTFDLRRTTLTANPSSAVVDSSITLTLRCLPLVKGKGHLLLFGSTSDTVSLIIIDSPVKDTLKGGIGDTDRVFSMTGIIYEFNAGEVFEGGWKIRLKPTFPGDSAFHFQASAILDSVWIADSARYYHVKSDVATKAMFEGKGFGTGTGSSMISLYPRK